MGQPKDRSDRVFAGPLKRFEQVFPKLDDVIVEYTEFEHTRELQKGLHSVKADGGLMRCGNDRCYRGGYELDFKIHEMVREGVTEKTFELDCLGAEGTPKRDRGHNCSRSIKAIVKLILKKA